MSLECGECRTFMQPSRTLPGREGTLVYPHFQSLVYNPSVREPGKTSYKMVYLEASGWVSLCLGCVESKLPEERKVVLRHVYTSYEAETRFREVGESQKGRFISGEESRKWLDAYDAYKKELEKLPNLCLFCEGDVKNGSPYFVAKVIDRVYSGQNLSGLLGEGNYSWSNIKAGSIEFPICFEDFRMHFPSDFAEIGYSMSGERNPNRVVRPSELTISPEFERALERETGKSAIELLGELGHLQDLIIRTENTNPN